MIRHSYKLLIAACVAVACVPVAKQSGPAVGSGSGLAPAASQASAYFNDKKIRMVDFVYEETIQTVLLYPLANDLDNPAAASLQPPVLPVEQGSPLVLEFDELGEEGHTYHAKIFHCNADWTISLLNDINFLHEYNDVTITNYQLSSNTKVPYTHYRMDVPKVKLPGNYVLMVHKEGNVKDLVLTKRFLIYDNTVDIGAKVTFSTGIQERNTHQQIDFSVNYRDYQINNPREEVKVVLRQNYRWDNAITNLKPLNVRINDHLLEYNYFTLENNFKGGNEFRFFDMRSIRFLGLNMAKVNPGPVRNEVLLMTDLPRAGKAFFQSDDFNGGFVVDNYETHLGATEADYVQTIFTLETDQPANGPVYVNGKFNDWLLNERNRMIYAPEAKQYKAQILLKQGIYNYDYAVAAPSSNPMEGAPEPRNEALLEGSYYNTENTYEIITYYRPIGSRADLIVGYKVIYHNARK